MTGSHLVSSKIWNSFVYLCHVVKRLEGLQPVPGDITNRLWCCHVNSFLFVIDNILVSLL